MMYMHKFRLGWAKLKKNYLGYVAKIPTEKKLSKKPRKNNQHKTSQGLTETCQ